MKLDRLLLHTITWLNFMHIKSKNEEKINTPQISDYRDHSSLIEHLKKMLKGIPRAKKKNECRRKLKHARIYVKQCK